MRRKMDKCWVYSRGRHFPDGYLKTTRGYGAARQIYSLLVKKVPAGLFLCHSCDNPPCINPSHLWVGTAKENVRDMMAKGRNKFVSFPGVAHWKSRLNVKKVRRIRALVRSGKYTQTQIGLQYGINQSAVSAIAIGKLWKHVPLEVANEQDR